MTDMTEALPQPTKREEELHAALDECLRNLDCETLHHKPSEYHEADVPCPVMSRLCAVLGEPLPPAQRVAEEHMGTNEDGPCDCGCGKL